LAHPLQQGMFGNVCLRQTHSHPRNAPGREVLREFIQRF
jgi:hypothetical protein